MMSEEEEFGEEEEDFEEVLALLEEAAIVAKHDESAPAAAAPPASLRVPRRKFHSHYVWESARTKPHARIVSRKKPPPIGMGSGNLTNVYGLTRTGIARAPHAILIGRPNYIPQEIDAPFGFTPEKTGKYKPNPLILSRPHEILEGSGSGVMQNVFGMTRFGKANPPRPVILSRHMPEDQIVPGPGAYDPQKLPDTRIPISITGRRKSKHDCTRKPGDFMLPPLSKGPAFSLKSRHYTDLTSQSPGPIYDTRETHSKGLSMTFKPFPMHEGDSLPGPSHYGRLPGEQAVKETHPTLPRVKFGKEYGVPFTEPNPHIKPGPGPAAVNLAEFYGTSKDKPHALILSRPPFKAETCGSGAFENLYGKTRFGVRRPPKAVVMSRHLKKEKFEPGPGAYDPHVIVDKRVGITIKSRIPEKLAKKGAPGPGSYNLKSFMGQGPAYSIVKKYFHNLEELERVPARRHDSLRCLKDDVIKAQLPTAGGVAEEDHSQAQNQEIDACIKYIDEARRRRGEGGNESLDPSSLIPFLEHLATS